MAAAKLPAFDLVDAFTLRVPAPDGSEGTTIDRLPFQDLVRETSFLPSRRLHVNTC